VKKFAEVQKIYKRKKNNQTQAKQKLTQEPFLFFINKESGGRGFAMH